jgi:PAS domain S-box-containing protein
MMHQHHPVYVAISILVAIIGSGTALALHRRVGAHAGAAQRAWLAAAAVAMGFSIWSMHFIAMLGYHAGVPVSYDLALTTSSLLLAIASTAVAFLLVESRAVPLRRHVLGALFMGTGICSMHYVGMAAVQAPARVAYDPGLVGLSLLIAVAASFTALQIAAHARSRWLRMLSAVGLGFAIFGMHYTGMAAAHFLPLGPPHEVGPIDNRVLGVMVVTSTLLILLLALGASMFDTRIELMAVRQARAAADRENYLRTVLGQLPTAVIVVDAPTGIIEYANPEAERLAGKKLVGQLFPSPEALRAVQGDGRDQADREHPASRARRGERVDRERLVCRRPDGSDFHVEMSAAPVLDAQGDFHQALIAFADITDRVIAEEAVRQGAKMQALGQLTGGIAHDFNNLLTPIVGGLDIINRSSNEPRTRRLADNALRSAERGSRLTAQLLAFSRMQRLELHPTLVAPLVAGMKGLLTSTLGPAIRIAYDLEEKGPVPVLADPTQLELMVLNLAINARDAMPAGGDLTIATRRRRIREDPDLSPGDYLELSVSDTGAGMPPDVMDRAFDPFFTTKESGKGTGLGLSMVYGVARQSGGIARIQSCPGAGTSVSVLFPRVGAAAADMSRASGATVSTLSRLRGTILLVDDDGDVRAFIANVLEDLGHRTLQAEDGAAGLALLAAEAVDLMIVDFAMPGLNGADVARAALRLKPEQKLLFVTGFADAAAIEDAAPGTPVLRKPFAAHHLVSAVEESLQGSVPTGRKPAVARRA